MKDINTIKARVLANCIAAFGSDWPEPVREALATDCDTPLRMAEWVNAAARRMELGEPDLTGMEMVSRADKHNRDCSHCGMTDVTCATFTGFPRSDPERDFQAICYPCLSESDQ